MPIPVILMIAVMCLIGAYGILTIADGVFGKKKPWVRAVIFTVGIPVSYAALYLAALVVFQR